MIATKTKERSRDTSWRMLEMSLKRMKIDRNFDRAES
jgi:hypothetical protein